MPDIACTVSGKIKSITRTNLSTKPNLEYLYDAMGNRITKIVKPAGSTSLDWVYTHYVRDAQGNVMATYKKENINQTTSYQLTERHIYGSSRVGIDNKAIELIGYTAPSDDLYRHQIGLKNYELTNHLGNVNAVITDRKIPRSTNGLNIDYYMPDIVSATDYYPFGAPMPGRQFNNGNYRFGFNGKENDAESNTQDYGMRIYNTRLCKFLSVDPITKQLPELTPYQFASNTPIMAIDLDGLEADCSAIFGMLWLDMGITKTDATQVETEINRQLEPIANSKVGKACNGAVNLTFGTVGFVACAGYTIGTDGAGGIAGGMTGMVLCKSEIALGFCQMADAFSDTPNENLHNINSILGCVMREKNVAGAEYADAAFQFLPGAVSGGNIKAIFKSSELIGNAISSKKPSSILFETLNSYDAVQDTWGVGEAIFGILTSDFRTNIPVSSKPKSADSGFVQSKELTSKEAEDIKNWASKLNNND